MNSTNPVIKHISKVIMKQIEFLEANPHEVAEDMYNELVDLMKQAGGGLDILTKLEGNGLGLKVIKSKNFQVFYNDRHAYPTNKFFGR